MVYYWYSISWEGILQSEQKKKNLTQKVKNLLHKLVHFFNWYEIIWLVIFVSAGITVSVLNNEKNVIYIVVLIAGLLMELTLAKRTRWCFLFVFVNSAGLIIIGFMNTLYSEMLINLIFWIPYAIIGFLVWSKHIDKDEHKNLTEVRALKLHHIAMLVAGALVVAYVWSLVLGLLGGNQPFLDALSTVLQLTTGVLIIFRIRSQWIFWILYIFVSAIIWILLQQWIMLVVSFGYLTNSIYGFISWNKYIAKNKE